MVNRPVSLFVQDNDPRVVRSLSDVETRALKLMGQAHKSKLDLSYPVISTDLEYVMTGGSDEVRMPLTLGIMCRRFATMTPDLRYVPTSIIFLAMVSNNPGQAVMYAYSLFLATLDNRSPVDIETLCVKYMPWGLPTDERLQEVWLHQKTESGANLLDNVDLWRIK